MNIYSVLVNIMTLVEAGFALKDVVAEAGKKKDEGWTDEEVSDWLRNTAIKAVEESGEAIKRS